MVDLLKTGGASELVVTAKAPSLTFRSPSSACEGAVTGDLHHGVGAGRRHSETDYAFDLGEGYPLPNPRLRFQPWGVYSPSRTVNHGQFPRRDHGWQAPPLGSGVLYELHVGTFSRAGTFTGAIGTCPILPISA